jgi:hypothetical protein
MLVALASLGLSLSHLASGAAIVTGPGETLFDDEFWLLGPHGVRKILTLPCEVVEIVLSH